PPAHCCRPGRAESLAVAPDRAAAWPSLLTPSSFRGPHLGRLAPYLERPWRRSATPAASRAPRMMWYRTPGRSLTRPPRTSTSECSCRLWPSPGMYAVTSVPLRSFTRATLRIAEFGFLGVVVYTRVQTPACCGFAFRAGEFEVLFFDWRPLRTNC